MSRIKHKAKPKTFNRRKAKYVPKLKMRSELVDNRQIVIARIAEATGWSESWLASKDDKLLMGMANKYL